MDFVHNLRENIEVWFIMSKLRVIVRVNYEIIDMYNMQSTWGSSPSALGLGFPIISLKF
jgi:hypothetical protein